MDQRCGFNGGQFHRAGDIRFDPPSRLGGVGLKAIAQFYQTVKWRVIRGIMVVVDCKMLHGCPREVGQRITFKMGMRINQDRLAAVQFKLFTPANA